MLEKKPDLETGISECFSGLFRYCPAGAKGCKSEHIMREKANKGNNNKIAS